MLHTLITTYPLGMQDLGVLRNLLEGEADGVEVLVGLYPHRGPQEELAVHIADVMGMQGGAEEQIPGEERGAANAAYVLRARRHLRHLVPFLLDAGAKTAVQKALKELNDWAREYWGPELVEIVEDDDENDTGGRPEPRAPLPPQRGMEGRPEPRARVQPPPLPEAELKGDSTESREPRRRFTSPSSLDHDD